MGVFTANGLYKPDAGEGGAAGLLNANWDLLDTAVGGGGGGGAPTTASYVTTAAEAGLSNEKVLGSGVIMEGTFAARPAFGTAGRLYRATDDGTIYRDTGAAWTVFAPGLSTMVDLSPASLTADQNDYSPAGLAAANAVRLDATGNRNITGIATGTVGRVLVLYNISSIRTLTLKAEDAGSAAANRFVGSQDFQLQPFMGVILEYDSTSSRWRIAAAARPFGSTISSIGTANSGGLSPNVPREDHVHNHGVIGGTGDLHTEYRQESVALVTADLANDAVTYAKMQNVSAASKLVGRGSAGGAGDPEEITLGSGLTMTGTTLAASGGGGGGTALGLVFNMDPRLMSQAVSTWAGTNRAKYSRTFGAAAITGIQIVVGTASGNISCATYSNTGAGTSARPNTRRQTSGAVACPASGVATVALGASDTMAEGDWFGMSCDNTTATFQRSTAASATSILNGWLHSESAAHPCPSPATPAAPAADALTPLQVGS